MPTTSEEMEKIPYHAPGNSTEYNQLVDHIHRLQASIDIQRAYRSKKGWLYKKAPAHFTQSGSSRTVLTEPMNDDYLMYAERISVGNYHDLNFKDPHFIRHIFKALRLSKISLNQMLMAHQIYDALEWLHDYRSTVPQLRRFNLLDPQSPYQASQISYATPERIARFKGNLKKEDQWYYVVNFTKSDEALFFKHAAFAADLRNFAIYVGAKQRATIHQEKKAMHALQQQESSRALISFLLLQSDIKQQEIQQEIPVSNTPSVNDSSMELLVRAVALEPVPSICLSPDFNADDPETPILSFVLLTPEAKKQLQLAVHDDKSVFAYPIAGQFDTRLIRAMIDDHSQHPEVREVMVSLYPFYQLDPIHRFRPVEIAHPDLVASPNPHNLKVVNAVLTWHDDFHVWRSGANFKASLQYLRNLLTQSAKDKNITIMNKPIWYLSDMDISVGHKVRRGVIQSKQAGFTIYIKLLNGLLQKNEARPDHTWYQIVFRDLLKNARWWNIMVADCLQLPLGACDFVPWVIPRFIQLLNQYTDKLEPDLVPNLASFLRNKLTFFPAQTTVQQAEKTTSIPDKHHHQPASSPH